MGLLSYMKIKISGSKSQIKLFLFCLNDTKSGEIIDPKSAILLPKNNKIKCTVDSDLGQIVDSKTVCLIWTCILKQQDISNRKMF